MATRGLLLLIFVLGCGSSSAEECRTFLECPSGMVCVDFSCEPAPDGGISDSGADVPPVATCIDGMLGTDETDVDCGGPCPACEPGQRCLMGSDCTTEVCGSDGLCADAACDDGVRNGAEVGTDCGGGCPGCPIGHECIEGSDCVSAVCTESICAEPTCFDGVRNGTESDVDCGGACEGCPECGACSDGPDCVRGRCAEGLCRQQAMVSIDWRANCNVPLTVPDLEAGDYLITAIDSAGTVWDPPYNPPTTGWVYAITCTDLSVPTVRTPSGTLYRTAAEAFANIMAPSEVVSWGGGDMTCVRNDSACVDNHGSVRFSMERVCE